jgi:hypothetical protein
MSNDRETETIAGEPIGDIIHPAPDERPPGLGGVGLRRPTVVPDPEPEPDDVEAEIVEPESDDVDDGEGGRSRRHPGDVTADRLDDHLADYATRLSPREVDAIRTAQRALSSIALGRTADEAAWLYRAETTAEFLSAILAEHETTVDVYDAVERARSYVEAARDAAIAER